MKATYNGLIPPQYITKNTGAKVEEDAHKPNNKKNDEAEVK